MPDRDGLLRQLTRMEAERTALLAELDLHAPARLEARPSKGGWTAAQVITHLAVIEEGALAYLSKKLSYGKHKRVGASTPLRFFILQTGIRLPVKYKAPPAVAVIPSTSYTVARERWCTAREKLIAAYTALPGEFISHELFKHSFMGRFGLVHAVRFLRRHMLRHGGQVRRILAALA